MEFAIVGDLLRSREEIERIIKKKGGSIAPRVHNRLAAVISNRGEVLKMGNQMAEAKAYDVQVVSEDFLIDIADRDPISQIIIGNLSSWGGDVITLTSDKRVIIIERFKCYLFVLFVQPLDRIEKEDVTIERGPAYFTKSVPEQITLKLKGHFKSINRGLNDFDMHENMVDPEWDWKDNNVRVYCTNIAATLIIKYSAILGFVDIRSNRNSYYRLQILESIEGKL